MGMFSTVFFFFFCPFSRALVSQSVIRCLSSLLSIVSYPWKVYRVFVFPLSSLCYLFLLRHGLVGIVFLIFALLSLRMSGRFLRHWLLKMFRCLPFVIFFFLLFSLPPSSSCSSWRSCLRVNLVVFFFSSSPAPPRTTSSLLPRCIVVSLTLSSPLRSFTINFPSASSAQEGNWREPRLGGGKERKLRGTWNASLHLRLWSVLLGNFPEGKRLWQEIFFLEVYIPLGRFGKIFLFFFSWETFVIRECF